MDVKKIVLVLVLLLVAGAVAGAILYFFDYDNLSVPLEEGADYIYTGNYITRGSQKSITMKAPPHRLYMERTFEENGKKKYLAAFYNGNLRWQSFILENDSAGLYAFVGRERVLIVPAKVKRGMKWQFNYGEERVEAVVGGRKKISGPSGPMKTREIIFSTRQRTRIKLYIAKDLGFAAINYSYVGSGAERAEADLILQEIKKPGP